MSGGGLVLVIGYGNTLRGDDGIGPAVALAVAEKHWPNVRVVAIPLLMPELAEDLAAARAAVFIDACIEVNASPVTVTPLQPAGGNVLPTHCADPRSLLALSVVLYGQAPPAWLVSVAGVDFGLKETLSTEGRHRARAAEEQIERLVRCS